MSNSKLKIRRLLPEDRAGLDKLRLSAASHLGVDAGAFTSKLRFVPEDFPYLNPADTRFIGFGAFDADDKMVSFMLSLIHEKAWYVQLIMSSQQDKAVKFNGIDTCTDWMIAYAEQRGIRDFWYSIPKKYERVHRTAWRKTTKLLSRYERNDVCVVPKYKRCQDSNHWKYLMSEMVLPIDVLIRHNHLPESTQLYEYKALPNT